MEAIKICLSFVLLVLYSAQNGEATTCQNIKDASPRAPSGIYMTSSNLAIPIQMYCEMGLNGGGYTFLPLYALTFLTNEELSSMFTNRTSFLLRARMTGGIQPYGVLSQLPENKNIPLMLSINNHTGYSAPLNKESIGEPYLYFGFNPLASNASKNSLRGLEINGQRIIFDKCDRTPEGQMTLFPNFREVQPAMTKDNGTVCDKIFSDLRVNPSGRVMPEDFFTFMEFRWGGCGCSTPTLSGKLGFLSVAIGFR